MATLRSLWKNAGFCLLVVAVLALGIGANTALFSIIDRVLLHPLPFRTLDRMVEITGLAADGRETASMPDEMDYFASHVRSFEGVAFWRWQSFVLTGVENADSIFALEVSERLFNLVGERPAIGRTFRPDE